MVLACNAKGQTVAASKMLHIATKGGKYTNPKKIRLNKKKASLKKGKSFKIKAKQIGESAGKKLRNHRKISYETSDPKVATVSKKGKVKAEGKGKCVIYIYAQNGVFTSFAVTVK